MRFKMHLDETAGFHWAQWDGIWFEYWMPRERWYPVIRGMPSEHLTLWGAMSAYLRSKEGQP